MTSGTWISRRDPATEWPSCFVRRCVVLLHSIVCYMLISIFLLKMPKIGISPNKSEMKPSQETPEITERSLIVYPLILDRLCYSHLVSIVTFIGRSIDWNANYLRFLLCLVLLLGPLKLVPGRMFHLPGPAWAILKHKQVFFMRGKILFTILVLFLFVPEILKFLNR